ncbi:hypothetical protein AAG906_005259 [Vitis piasezkii]
MEKSQQTLASSSSSHFVPISFNHSTSVKLENHNFLIWRKQIFSAIRGHNLQHFVIGVHDPPLKFRSSEDRSRGIVNQDFLDWEQQDQLLVSWLLSSMSEGVLLRCINCESAFQIWKTLEVYFASQTQPQKQSLSMNEYLLKIRGFVYLLALVGVNLSVKDHIDAITDGLPSEYDTFFLIVNSRTEDYSVEEIESLLLAQEVRIEKHNKRLDSETTFFSPNFGRGNFSPKGRDGFQGRGGFNNVCMKIGHSANRYYYIYDPSFQGPRTAGFTPSFQKSSQTQIQGGNKPNMQVLMATPENICDTNWYPDSSASNHVTANANNLVEHTPYYGSEQVRVGNDQVSKIVVLEGKLKGGLYAFDSSQIQLQKSAPSQVSLSQSVTSHQSGLSANCQNGSSTVGLWHDRLGHPSFKIVQTVMSLCKLSKFNKILLDSLCKACCLGKIHMLPFPTSISEYQEPLQLVYSDLWGPSPVQSSNGYKYYICFVDAFSRISCPHTHQQNGVAERKHRHIVENGLTLLARASMSFKYWDESFRTTVFLHNRLPSPVSHASLPSPIALIPPVNTTTHLENCQDSNAPIVSSSIPSTAGNIHSMITRSKKGIIKPKVYTLQNENWKIAMIDEYSTLLRNNTWSLVDLPAGRKVIGCKWIFRVKENPDGSINKYKARLVAKGFHQTTGFDYTETFSPVVKPTTIRVVLTIALSRNWKIQQLDINNAFFEWRSTRRSLYGTT